MIYSLPRRLLAEFLGTALLLATVVGSGIMADRLTDDVALTLLVNSLATGAMLAALIAALGPVSGAHLNPAVSTVMLLRGDLPHRDGMLYLLAQMAGGCAGVVLAHAMFDLPLWQLSATARAGNAQLVSEAVATFGLVFTVLAGLRFRREAIPWMVGLYITAAYWFTASTSFANPAVTLARAFSDTFTGIRITDATPFIAVQFAGAVLAWVVARLIFEPKPAPLELPANANRHLSQSGLRDVPQRPRHDPPVRR